MKDGLVSNDTKAVTASGTTVVAGTFSGGDVIVAADSISKTEVGNEIPFTQASGTQQIIQTGTGSINEWIVFPTAFGAEPVVVPVGYTTGSHLVVSVVSGAPGSFCTLGSSFDGGVYSAAGSIQYIAIGNSA